MKIEMKIEGMDKLLLRLRIGRKVQDSINSINKEFENRLRGTMNEFVPVDTGAYRDSMETGSNKGGVFIGTSAPQARRLEFGFVGSDSLGRHYSQAPRPHFRPTLDKVGPEYDREVRRAVLRLFA